MKRSISADEDPIVKICRKVLEIEYPDLPGKVINYGKDTIIDTLSVTIGGSAMEGIPAMVGLVKERGGIPQSVIPFYGGRVPAAEAGLAIGPMSRAMDYGNIHKKANHCGEYILPALVAATGLKKKVTGKEFITAFILGCEVLVRIGIAFNQGLSTTRVGGHFIFGCVAAVGKLLDMNFTQMLNAQGIASGMTQPHTMSMFRPESTLMIRVHHGFVCQDAINACLLAQRGITGPHQGVLAAPLGYLGFAGGETNPDLITDDFGQNWEFLNLVQKHYPSVAFSQNPIDGILDQMHKHNFGAGEIDSIQIDMAGAPPEVKSAPLSEQDCQFNLPYLVATAAYDGDITTDSYSLESRRRPEILKLMSRISIYDVRDLKEMAIRMRTNLKNGRKITDEYLFPKGDPRNPLTPQDLENKFRKCVRYSAYLLTEDKIRFLISSLQKLDEVDDVVQSVLIPLTPD